MKVINHYGDEAMKVFRVAATARKKAFNADEGRFTRMHADGIVTARLSVASYQSALTLILRPGLPRHGRRRPAIHVFAVRSKERHGWPAFADHDDAVTAECHVQRQLVSHAATTLSACIRVNPLASALKYLLVAARTAGMADESCGS